MSRGTPVSTVRIPDTLKEEIQMVIERSEQMRPEGAHTLSSLIVSGLQEHLNHLERARKSRRLKKGLKKIERSFRAAWEVLEAADVVNLWGSVESSRCLSLWMEKNCEQEPVSFIKEFTRGWIKETEECEECSGRFQMDAGGAYITLPSGPTLAVCLACLPGVVRGLKIDKHP